MQQIGLPIINHVQRFSLIKKASQKHVPERSYEAEGKGYIAHKRGLVCTQLCLYMPCARKGIFFFLLFHFYKYDVSYKMLSHLKVHSILFNIENIVTTINYSNT